MYCQCDIDGNQFVLMDLIVSHKSDGAALKIEDMYFFH